MFKFKLVDFAGRSSTRLRRLSGGRGGGEREKARESACALHKCYRDKDRLAGSEERDAHGHTHT